MQVSSNPGGFHVETGSDLAASQLRSLRTGCAPANGHRHQYRCQSVAVKIRQIVRAIVSVSFLNRSSRAYSPRFNRSPTNKRNDGCSDFGSISSEVPADINQLNSVFSNT